MVPYTKGRPIYADSARCYGCLTCELRCSLRFEQAFNRAKAQILVRRLAGAPTEYAISFTERCDNCGICVRYCPYGALTQQDKKGVAK